MSLTPLFFSYIEAINSQIPTIDMTFVIFLSENQQYIFTELIGKVSKKI